MHGTKPCSWFHKPTFFHKLTVILQGTRNSNSTYTLKNHRKSYLYLHQLQFKIKMLVLVVLSIVVRSPAALNDRQN